MRILQVPVKQAVLDESGPVHRKFAAIQLVDVDIDLDEIRRLHLGKVKSKGIDQECVVLVRHLYRDVIEDGLVPAHHREDTIGGSKLLPRLPLLVRHLVI